MIASRAGAVALVTLVASLLCVAIRLPGAAAAPADPAAHLAPLAADPLELWVRSYRGNPRPGEIPVRIKEFVRRGAFAPGSGRRAELLRFFSAALRKEPAAQEKVRAEALASSRDESEALVAVDAATRGYLPLRAEAAGDLPLLWAEYRATGDPACIWAVIGMLAAGSPDEPQGLAASAAASLFQNVPRHGGTLRIVDEALLASPEPLKARLTPVAGRLNVWHDQALALNTRGANHEMVERYAEAIQAYRAAIDLWPDYARPYRNLADLCFDEDMKERYPEALAAMQIAAALLPGDSRVLAGLGRAHFRLGQHEEAVRWLSKAVESDPGDDFAAHLIGRAQLRRGDGPAALGAFRAYLALDPAGERLSSKEKAFLSSRGVVIAAGSVKPFRSLLAEDKHAELEQRLRVLLREKRRGDDGLSLLFRAYGEVSALPGSETAQRTWMRRIEDWVGRAPDSHFAHAILGDAYVSYGWEARGTGSASTVQDEGWMLFTDRLLAARKHLERAYALDPSDPFVPTRLITIAKGLGFGRDELDTQFRRAVQADPALVEPYAAKLDYLLPKWVGSEAECLAFAREAAAQAPPGSRIPLVLAAAHRELSENLLRVANDGRYYRDPEVWKELRPVYERHLAQFPKDSAARNQFARTAYQSGDLATAGRELAALGGDVDRGIWGGTEAFEAARKEIGAP